MLIFLNDQKLVLSQGSQVAPLQKEQLSRTCFLLDVECTLNLDFHYLFDIFKFVVVVIAKKNKIIIHCRVELTSLDAACVRCRAAVDARAGRRSRPHPSNPTPAELTNTGR